MPINPAFLDMQTANFVVPIIGGKGGIGKSIVAQLIAAKLGTLQQSVLMVDTDHTNSSTRTVEPDAVMIDLLNPMARGAIMVALQRIATGEYQSIVMDTGAQEQRYVADWLPWLAREAARIGALLVPVLPITLSSHAQAMAVDFADAAAALGCPTLLVRNLGQGRERSDYAHWDSTRTRKGALDRGAVEIELPNLGARWTDEASGFGLSLADAAAGRFHKAGELEAAARSVFVADVRAWLNIFVSEFGDAFADGLEQAVGKRAQLDREV